MDKKTKFIVLGLVCIVATAVLFSLQIYAAKSALEAKVKLYGKENSQLGQKNLEIQSEIRNLENNIFQLKAQLEKTSVEEKENQAKIEDVVKQLDAEKKAKTAAEGGLDELKKQNTLLLSQLDLLNVRKSELETDILNLRSAEQRLKDKVSQMQSLLKEKTKTVTLAAKSKQRAPSRSQAIVVSAPIVVKPAALVAKSGLPDSPKAQEVKKVLVKDLPVTLDKAPPVFSSAGTYPVDPAPESGQKSASGDAKVLVVNSENNFVIIDIGEQSAVKRGDKFSVYRDGKTIASLEVIRTRKSVSACDIKSQDSPILAGDIIRG